MGFMQEEFQFNFHGTGWLLLIIFPTKMVDASVKIETKLLFRYLRPKDIAFAFEFGMRHVYTTSIQLYMTA